MTMIIDLTSHTYEGATVRTSRNEAGEPLFVAKDVCDVLGMDHSKALERIPDWARIAAETSPSDGEVSRPNKGGRGRMAMLTEAGVYWLVLRSDKPGAEAFQKWVCLELLPTIRRTGGYGLGAEVPAVARLRLRLRAAELRAQAQALEAQARALGTGGNAYDRALAPAELAGAVPIREWLRTRGFTGGEVALNNLAQKLRRRLIRAGQPVGKALNADQAWITTARPADLVAFCQPRDLEA